MLRGVEGKIGTAHSPDDILAISPDVPELHLEGEEESGGDQDQGDGGHQGFREVVGISERPEQNGPVNLEGIGAGEDNDDSSDDQADEDGNDGIGDLQKGRCLVSFNESQGLSPFDSMSRI